MSKQSDLVNITQGDADINGGTIDGTVIGGSTPAAISGTTGQFDTSLNVDGTITSDGLTVDTNTLFVDAANNRVGIGTINPATTLDVSDVSRYTFNVSNAYTLQTSINAAGSAFADDYKNAAQHIWQSSGAESMRIDSAGRVTTPYQPMFSALNLATSSQYPVVAASWRTFDSNLTNWATPHWSAETNIGGHFSGINGRFTAPVGGRYLITMLASFWVTTTMYITLFKNGVYSSPYSLAYNADLGGYQNMSLTRVMTLAAGDYIEPGGYVQSGTYVPGAGYLQFSGYLIG